MAAADAGLAEAIAEAVRRVDASLVLVGLAGSELIRAGAAAGLATAAEAFADRRYRQDGTLVPRREPGAMIGDAAEAVGQVLRLAAAGRAQTVCVHGDGPHALEFAARVRQGLQEAGWRLAPAAGGA
jgi:UPF0271 protein